MILRDVVERLESKAPFSVMMRATLENVLSAERMDAIFVAHARQQRQGKLLFSALADIMGGVACRIHASPHAAFQARVEEIGVTAKVIYDKLQGVEPEVSRAMVRETACSMAAIIQKMKVGTAAVLPRYHTKILDGNHLRRTERRIAELRAINGAPLPGQALVVLDPQLRLAIDVFPCEDGHAQERSLLPQVLKTVQPLDLWIADRNFCTIGFLLGIAAQGGRFVIRQHGQMPYELSGKRQRVGNTETGVVYEQSLCIRDATGKATTIRRITVELYEPTRDGDREMHILTNLPKRVAAVRVAELYRGRWTIETAFQELAQNLHGEVRTLGYPKAALFAFCAALLAYNVWSVMRAALGAAHGVEKIEEEFSVYYLADEVAHTYRGMDAVIPDAYWTKHYAHLSPTQMARELIRIARTIYLPRYRKHKRGPKKPPVKMKKTKRNHVSTARILAESEAVTS
jgi:IS4 transposase